MTKHTKLLIVGGGPAGLQLALTAATEGIKDMVLLLKGPPGGQIVQTPKLENVAGVPAHGITGKAWIHQLVEDCLDKGVQFVHSETGALELQQTNGKSVIQTGDVGKLIADVVVLAVGTTWRQHESVANLNHMGHIYYGPSKTTHVKAKGKHYGVIGSANSAAQGILALADRGAKVSVLCRHILECSAYLAERIHAHDKVKIVSHVMCQRIDHIYYQRTAKHEYCMVLDTDHLFVDGVFIMAGQVPNTEFLRNTPGLKLDRAGFIKQKNYRTTLDGVFAIGDCRTDCERHTVVNATGDASRVFPQVYTRLTS